MSKKANSLAIGIFVLVAIGIAIGSAIVLSAGEMFKDVHRFVLYFDGDLSGLDAGAPVDFKGVSIGRVTDISIVYDYKDNTVSVPVIIEIDRKCFTEINCQDCPTGTMSDGMDQHIERGLRAQLKTQSLVTGKLKVTLVYRPDTPIVLKAGKKSELDEIPTIPGSLDSIAKQISDLPLEEMVMDLRQTTKAISAIAESGEVQDIVSSLSSLAKRADSIDLEQIATNITSITESLSALVGSGEVREIMKTMNETLDETKGLLSTINEASDPLRNETLILMEHWGKAAESIRFLVEYLERHPESFIYGKGKE